MYLAACSKCKRQSSGQTNEDYRGKSIYSECNGRKYCESNGTDLTEMKVASKKTPAGTLAIKVIMVFQKISQLLSMIKTDGFAPTKIGKYWMHTPKGLVLKLVIEADLHGGHHF